MTVYQLTYPEAWALATLLHLPVQPGSALADWLASAPTPQVDEFFIRDDLEEPGGERVLSRPEISHAFG